MDEDQVRERAEAHGRAVVENDLRTAGADLTPEGMKDAATVMPQLPKPVTASEVLSVEPAGSDYLVRIHYSGEDGDATVGSRWTDRDGRPMITAMSVS